MTKKKNKNTFIGEIYRSSPQKNYQPIKKSLLSLIEFGLQIYWTWLNIVPQTKKAIDIFR